MTMAQHKSEHHSNKKLEKLELGETTPLKTFVWRLRVAIRDFMGGRDVLDVERKGDVSRHLRHVYRKVDQFMAKYFPGLKGTTPKNVAVKRVEDVVKELGYTVVEKDANRPWGAFFRMANSDADRFVREFFPDLSLHDAKLGNDDAELSPKFLIVAPGQRLSWQYHYRRAERWRFLNDGAYYRSESDDPGKQIEAKAGVVVQFAAGERHRLCARTDAKAYTLVAEIWQHTDPSAPSDEDDIVRLADDYQR